MSRRRKFRKGNPIASVEDAVREILHKRYVIVRDKPMHPAWMIAMTLKTIRNLVGRGFVFYAEPAEPFRDFVEREGLGPEDFEPKPRPEDQY